MKLPSTYTVHFESGQMTLPAQCIADIARSGPADDAVAYWVGRVNWSGMGLEEVRWELEQQGTWSDEELEEDDDNRERFLWLAAWQAKEEIDALADRQEGGAR